MDANYSIDELNQVDVSYALGTRLTFMLPATSKEQSYKLLAGAPVDDLTSEKTYDIVGQATYVLTRHLSFILNVGDEERSANFPGLNYSSTRAEVTAKATF